MKARARIYPIGGSEHFQTLIRCSAFWVLLPAFTAACGQPLDDFGVDSQPNQGKDGGVAELDAGVADGPDAGPSQDPDAEIIDGGLRVLAFPKPVDFGYAAAGESKSRTLRVENREDDAVQISVASLSGEGFELVTDPSGPLDADSTMLFELRFVSGGPGEHTGVLTLDLCNGGCISEIALIGRGLTPNAGFVCDPQVQLVFVSGECKSETFDCYNQGPDPVDVLNIDVGRWNFGGYEKTLLEPTTFPRTATAGAPFPFSVEVCAPAIRSGGSERWSVSIEDGSGPRQIELEIDLETLDARDGCGLWFYSPVNFGRVAVGETVVRSIELRESGGCPLNPALVDGAAGFEVLSAPFVLSGDGSVDVAFSPAVPGEASDRLYPHPAHRIELVGTGIQPGFPMPYQVSSRSEEFDNFAGNELPWEGGLGDGHATLSIPFPFEFVGTSTTEVHVSANGFVSFEPLSGSTLINGSLPDGAAPNSVVAWWWDDLRSQEGAWLVEGTEPNRVLRIRMESRYTNGEIRLFEAGSAIEIHYDHRRLSQLPEDDDRGFSASAGWEGPNGMTGTDILGCSPNCTEFDRPSNVVYRLTP